MHNCVDTEDWILFHATCARQDFEIPRGPAFFYLEQGTGEKYLKLYHSMEYVSRAKSREKQYMIKNSPTVVSVESVSGEQRWVEENSDLRLPLVMRGRGSVIDRWPTYTNQIVKVYEDNHIDGLYDKFNDIVVIFKPEKFLEYVSSQKFSPTNSAMENIVWKR